MSSAEPDNQNDSWDFSRPQDQQPADDWNPYASTTAWSQSAPVMTQGPTVSALSILSLISGIVSIPLICLCFFSIPFSLFAIVGRPYFPRYLPTQPGTCYRQRYGSRRIVAGVCFAADYSQYVCLYVRCAFQWACRFSRPRRSGRSSAVDVRIRWCRATEGGNRNGKLFDVGRKF